MPSVPGTRRLLIRAPWQKKPFAVAIDALIDEFEENAVEISGLVSAMREYPDLKERFRKAVVLPCMDFMEGQLVQIIRLENPIIPRLIEIVPGVLYRLLFSGEQSIESKSPSSSRRL